MSFVEQEIPESFSSTIQAEFPKVSKLSKGKFGPVLISMWNAFQDCDPRSCPLQDECHYKETAVKCTVQTKYIKSVLKSILIKHAENIDEDKMTKLGYHLIPLYTHLIRFKMTEFGITNVCYTTEKGVIKIHPLYKEIRATIKAIQDTYSNIFPSNGGAPVKENGVDTYLYGDPDYYDEINDDGIKKIGKGKGKLRRNR